MGRETGYRNRVSGEVVRYNRLFKMLRSVRCGACNAVRKNEEDLQNDELLVSISCDRNEYRRLGGVCLDER